MRYLPFKKLTDASREAILNEVSSFVASLPDGHPSADSLRKSIFKKFQPQQRDEKLHEVAKQRFLLTEQSCRATNLKVRAFRRGLSQDYADSGVLYLAGRKIRDVLGPFSIDRMLTLSRFGKGATYGCRGSDVSRARKFSLTDVTPEFNKLARGLLAEYPLWASALSDSEPGCPVCPMLEVVPGGRYLTVPKDSSTDRSIIVEPTINSWFQQGIGRMIRERLKRKTSVDLDDQSINRRLAYLGSLSDDIATVDLSDASDLISKQLVEDLLPEDWFFWLNATRSHRVLVDGSWIELEKFSSMGNGFTFDLQSLIYYALSWAITTLEGYNPFWVNVFGDDIVVPSGVKERFLSVFADVGFKVNVSKSYFEGPFRESCGKDYYLGRDVRGVYLKVLRTDFDVLKLHNRMYEWGLRNPDLKWDRLRSKLLHHLSHIKARVPPSVGDLGVFSSFDEAHPITSRDGWDALGYLAMMPVLAKRQRSDRFLVLDRLQGSDFARNDVPLRADPVAFTYQRIWVFPDGSYGEPSKR